MIKIIHCHFFALILPSDVLNEDVISNAEYVLNNIPPRHFRVVGAASEAFSILALFRFVLQFLKMVPCLVNGCLC